MGDTVEDSNEAPSRQANAESSATVWSRVKEHKVVQWSLGYLGVALALAQAHELVAAAFGWPAIMGRVLMVTLIVGFPIAVTVAWYHGHRGLQKISAGELAIVSLLLLIGALFFSVAVRPSIENAVEQSAPTAAFTAPAPSAMNDVPSVATDAPATLPNLVAVLPCESISVSPADPNFAAGLHEEIIQRLGKLQNLNVMPRRAMLPYADRQLSVAQIAAELRARALLDCTVRYANDRLRVTANLLDASGTATLWSDIYDNDFADVFAIQADIAMNVANALAVEFSPEERNLIATPASVSPLAYKLYLEAIAAVGMEPTIALHKRAIEADPNFAAPYGALAWAYSSRLLNQSNTNAVSATERAEVEARAREYAERALAIDPSTPWARAALAVPAMLKWHWTDAAEQFRAARETAPNDITNFEFYLLTYLGRHDEAEALVERAVKLEPRIRFQRGVLLGYRGDYDRAAETLRASMTDVPILNVLIRDWLTRVEIARGDFTAAAEELALAERLPDAFVVFLPIWAYCYGRIGDLESARRIVARIREAEAAGDSVGAGGWALASLALDEDNRALEWLETAAQKAANHEMDEGFFNLMALRMNVTDDPRLKQARFRAVLERIRGD
jgi:TolB-like protein